jgi:hypothetical protein
VQWRRSVVIGCVAGALALSGCATPGYDESRVQSELVHAGTTVEQARCVTKGLTDTYAGSQLGSHSAPLEEEYRKTRAILAKCKVTLPIQPR